MIEKGWRVVFSLALVAAACGNGNAATDTGVSVLATTTILGDVARNIVGDDGEVEVLLPVGADPHDYQASSRQAAAIQEADLVIANGLSLEEGLGDVLENAAGEGANVMEIAALVGDDEDPHVWMDPVRMAEAGRLIATELSAIDGDVDWTARAEAYAAKLVAADTEIAALLDAVPDADRKLVTNHGSLGYFAARYDFDVVGVVIPGGATLAEPSSAELARLVTQIEREGVVAIFAEATEPAALAEAVAAEIGSQIAVVELYTGSLGEAGSGADTLIGLLVTDAERIASALTR